MTIIVSILLLALNIFPSSGKSDNKKNIIPLPTQTSSLFSGSGNCALCHISNGTVLTENGVDISPVTHWRSAMMGNSSKDPLWRAVVEHEVHELPQYQFIIESTCTKCHAPMGWKQAIYQGDSGYTMSQLKQNPLANDGVSCTSCHQIKSDNFGMPSSYSGGYVITGERNIYGPYVNPLTGPMINFVNYMTLYSAHVSKSELCATCHTLFTPTINYSGQIVGSFAEQTPYLEWKNSIYRQNSVNCQNCHMPSTSTPQIISTTPPNLSTLRTPYWKHLFMGSNKLVGKILRDNADSLQLSASPQHFDTTLAHVDNFMKNSSLLLNSNATFSSGLMNINLGIDNLTGHEIPTGIPFRRIWVHLVVKDAGNNIVFESGGWNSNGEILSQDSTYEEHYNVITNQNQVQIYEGVLQDVNNNVTYDLLHAASYKKDNRIPPKGFTTTHPSYDSIAIIGLAATDTNFNRQGTTQGTGKDIITYKVPALANSNYNIMFEVCYQTASPRLMTRLASSGTPDVQKFLAMYSTAQKAPTVMKSITYNFSTTGIKPINSEIPIKYDVMNYPNPFNPTTIFKFHCSVAGMTKLKVYDILGKEVAVLVNEQLKPGIYEAPFNAEGLTSGMYFYRFESGNFVKTGKLVLIK
jgi:hypothetical protein